MTVSEPLPTPRPARQRRRPTRQSLAWWGRWPPLLLAAAYLFLLAVQFERTVATVYLDADTASAPVIGELFGSAPGHAVTVLGQFGWYSTLLFELATKWLPLHRQIWEAGPYAMALLGIASTVWASWRVAGALAASLCAALLICAAPHTLQLTFSMTEHGPTWFCLAFLGALLVLLERHATTLRRPQVILAVLLVGVLAGTGLASDPLVGVAGLLPLLAGAAVPVALHRSADTLRALAAAAATVLVALVTTVLTHAVMSGLAVSKSTAANVTGLTSGDGVAHNVHLWWQSIAVLANGDFFGRPLTALSGLALVCALTAIAAVILVPRLAVSELRTAAAARVDRAPAARSAFVVYWAASAALLTLAFWVSTAPVDINADRYLVGLLYAAAAVVPAVATAPGRRLVAVAAVAGTVIVALAGVISMAKGTVTENTGGFPSDAIANRIAAVAAQDRLHVGYAGYWDAAPITWATRLRVRVYPVWPCPSGGRLCPFYLHLITSWYVPRPGIHSFLLSDPTLPFVPTAPSYLGRPTAVYRIGEVTMSVYPYDIAARLG